MNRNANIQYLLKKEKLIVGGIKIYMKKGLVAVLTTLIGSIVGIGVSTKFLSRRIAQKNEHLQKMNEFYNILNYWLSLKQRGISLVDYFEKNGYKTIAIYGMKELGERLYTELAGTDIEVKYIIDKNADEIYAEVDVVPPDVSLGEVDVIVVTACHYFNEIQKMLSQRVDYPVIPIEDVIYAVG